MGALRIFISSTSSDLLDYRQAASEAIRGLDQQADDMIVWSADDRHAAVYSVDRVKQSDALILLVAHRYGTVPDGEQYSVTELEYLAARDAKVPVLAFFVDPEVPWPPKHVDVDAQRRAQLDAFKQRVERDITRKQFRTPQELAFGVTQALAHLISRPAERTPARRFSGDLNTVRPVSTPSQLLTTPDALVPIGLAEDNVPLLLDVSRSGDLSTPLAALRTAVSSPDHPPPDELLETFTQSLLDYATRSWAEQDLRMVRLREGEQRRMYVTPFTLAEPFRSLLAKCLGSTGRALRYGRDVDHRTYGRAVGTVPQHSAASPPLQSTGGQNRYLAIDPCDGATYSVGWDKGDLVAWRPFLCESALPVLPATTLSLNGSGLVCGAEEAASFLMQHLSDQPRLYDGRLSASTRLIVHRQALMSLLCDVADRLSVLHAEGKVHGDVKPDNILVHKSGVQLIDSFDVAIGGQTPGWTPDWSAPEQVRGEAVSTATDIYPLALIAVEIIGGEIVGEVRKYRTPSVLPALPPEVDLYHSPSLFIDRRRSLIGEDGMGAWRDLIERSLSFDPDRRPASASEFADALRTLVDTYPVAGTVEFQPTGELFATRLIDGSEAVARVVSRPATMPTLGYYGV